MSYIEREDTELIQAIQDGVETVKLIHQPEGWPEPVASQQLHLLPRRNFTPSLVVNSLSALSDYIAANKDELEKNKAFVHVADPTTVNLCYQVEKPTDNRFYPVIARWAYEPFEFEQWHGHEDFCLKLKSKFVDAGDRQALLDVVSKIVMGDERTLEDDGFIQNVLVKVSVGTNDRKDLPTEVTLIPVLTFSEIAQPEFTAVLRGKRANSGGGIALGLFNADGGIWIHNTVRKIKEHLTKEGAVTLPIIA